MAPRGKASYCVAVADEAEQLLGAVGRQPEHRTLPRVGRSSPVIRFISVVLPEPFGPTRPVIPGSIARSTRLTPSTSP